MDIYRRRYGHDFFLVVLWTEAQLLLWVERAPSLVHSGFEVGLRNPEALGLATRWGDPWGPPFATAREARSEARLLSEVSGHPNVVALPLGS